MRILMFTDDVMIDRRILQEAETLIDKGHEVILLAADSKVLPEYELMGRVKVERVRHHAASPLSGSFIVQAMIGMLTSFIPTIHMARRMPHYLTTRAASGLRTPIRFMCRSMRKMLRFLPSGLKGPIRFMRRSVRKMARILSAGLKRPIRFMRRSVRKMARILSAGIMFGSKGLILLVRILVRALSRKSTLLPNELAIIERVQRYDPDVIHAHDLPRLRVAVHAKRRFKIPLIYDAHELYPEINTLSWPQKQILSRLEKRLVRHCDHIITVNPYIAKEMSERYGISAPSVVYNAIDRPEGFDPTVAPNRFRETMSIPAGDAILLYQGWMSRTRGLQELVRAMGIVGDGVHLVLMGYGEARAELEQIVRDKNLGERVHFKEAVSQDDLLYWTASADAGIIPYQPIDLNNYYSSPNKLFEFIQAALPVIANDLPFLREVVGQERFGVVAKLESEQQYSGAIREMFDASQGGPGRFRQRLLERASEYNWAKEEKKISAIYDQVGSA